MLRAIKWALQAEAGRWGGRGGEGWGSCGLESGSSLLQKERLEHEVGHRAQPVDSVDHPHQQRPALLKARCQQADRHHVDGLVCDAHELSK